MKDLTEISVNDMYQDTIIEHYPQPQKEGSHIVGIDKDGYAPCNEKVKAIIVYLKDDDNYSNTRVIKISPSSIIRLYNLIKEIEERVSLQFID